MNLAIVGTGEVGAFYAERWSQAGHSVVLTYFRDQDKAVALVTRLGRGVSLAMPHQAVKGVDVILFCPRLEHLNDAVRQIGEFNGIVIDAINPFNPERTAPDLGGGTAAQLVAKAFPGASVVKALHNLGIKTIEQHSPRPLAGFVAGDDAEAVQVVSGLLREAGLAPVPTGSLATARLSEYPGPLFGRALSEQEAREALR